MIRTFTAFAILLVAGAASAAPVSLRLWHSYRGAEEQALTEALKQFQQGSSDIVIEALANPYEGYASKLTTAIPNDNGPDVFIFAHERIGGWVTEGIVGEVAETPEVTATYFPETLAPLRVGGKLRGLPLAFKSVALILNRKLVPEAPKTTDELLRIARENTKDQRFGLVYQAGDFFFHAAWHLGFGGELLDDAGRAHFQSAGSIAALDFVRGMASERLMPEEPTGSLVSQLFNEQRAAMVINGPWFLGEIDPSIDAYVAPLPVVSATGRAASPLLTVEAVFVSGRTHQADASAKLARFLAETAAPIRASVGRQLVANRATWDGDTATFAPTLQGFRAQLATATPTPNRPEMRNVWEPATLGLKKVLRGQASAADAARAAQRRYEAIAREAPAPASPTPFIILAALATFVAIGLVFRKILAIRRSREASAAVLGATWVGPAMIATFTLIFVPFAVGLVMSLFDYRQGTWTFVGFANFIDIISARSFAPNEPLSFYYALVVTIVWTIINLGLHVGIGLTLALLLNRPTLHLKPIYRVLLIVPWAVPNYITALLWKGLFHKQFGAINGLLEALGLERVSWFSSFGTAFFANICANAWLGFPFMMVVCLGALQSIPTDLYEAADIDGASAFDKFRHVTLPLLRPALVPAVLLGLVWTFNQFNVVYLVSGGEPDNATDILISEAYRWAFARQEQYGYAAAYAALIFVLLLGWSAISQRIAHAAETSR